MKAILLAGSVLLATMTSACAAPSKPAAPATVKTASGIEITMLTAGQGAKPAASDVVKVNYRGTLADGREFDSSFKRREPATFPLNRVIPCWKEGMQHIKVGGRARLVCPSAQAYGPSGIPGVIPPNATLTFEVELIDIVR